MIHRALLLALLVGVGYLAIGKFGIENAWLSSAERAGIAKARAEDSILAYKEALERGESGAFLSLFNEGAFSKEDEFPGTWEKEITGRAGAENLHVEITKSYIDGGDILFQVEKKWTEEKTGEEKREDGVVVGKIEDGKIVEWKEYTDQSPFLQAEGTLPLDKADEILLTPEQTLASYCQLLSQQ